MQCAYVSFTVCRFPYAAGLVIGTGALAVYLATVAPGIPGGDAGELVAESCHLGTAHPPGYPLFTILNYVTTRGLPGLFDSVGLRPGPGIDGRASPAWCANATASVMGALAVLFTAQTTHMLLCARWWGGGGSGDDDRQEPSQQQEQHGLVATALQFGGVKYGTNKRRSYQRCWWHGGGDDGTVLLRELASGCAALLMAFSPLTWQYSVTAEVFALNNLLLSLLCSLAVRFSFRRDLTTATGGALVSGLALSNQHTAVLYVAPLAAWVMLQLVTSRCRHFNALQQQRQQQDQHQHPWRRLYLETMVLVTFFLLGLTPYAFLPLAAKHAPRPGSWGNVATWAGFLHHLRRGDYGSLRLYSGKAGGGGSGGQDCLDRLWRWLSDLSFEQGLGGIVPALATLGILSLLFLTPAGGGREAGAHVSVGVASASTVVTEKRKLSSVESSCGPLVAPSFGSRKKTRREKRNVTSWTAPLAPAGKATKCQTRTEGSEGADCDDTGNEKQQQQQANNGSESTTPATRTVVNFLASWDDAGLSAPTALIASLLVYLIVFHWLSNMPLDDPLLFGIHARFWMQPNIVVFVFCGVGMYGTFNFMRSVEETMYYATEVNIRFQIRKRPDIRSRMGGGALTALHQPYRVYCCPLDTLRPLQCRDGARRVFADQGS